MRPWSRDLANAHSGCGLCDAGRPKGGCWVLALSLFSAFYVRPGAVAVHIADYRSRQICVVVIGGTFRQRNPYDLAQSANRACGLQGLVPLPTGDATNELYLKAVDLKRVSWQNRAHFFAICAKQMRWILTDLYRAKQYQKRGGGAERVSLDASAVVSRGARRDLLAIDEALHQLANVDKRKSEVVELRFFGGLSVKETAEVLKVSPETVMRDWKLAKAWLLGELRG
jgi:RNA polymerase sigma factor (TIGR02999 family)